MFKLIKYELIGRYKYLLAFCGLLILANLVVLIKIGGISSSQNGAAVAISSIIGFVAVVITIISGVTIYRRDLFGDTGYLLFTIPQSGYSIIASKLIVALIEFLLISILSGVMVFIQVLNVAPRKEILSLIGNFTNTIVYSFGFYVLGFLTIITLIYFSLTVAKAVLKGRRFGKITSFAVFLLSAYILGVINDYMVRIFPKTVHLKFLPVEGVYGSLRYSDSIINLNIASLVFNSIIYISLFTLTGYLIDKKIDI